jgi:hypothetical protein
MTASQRAGCIVACTNWRPNGVRYSSAVIAGLDSSAPGAELTTEEMAERANVSPRTITHAKAAHEKGLGKEVRSGKVSAKRAAEGKVKKPAGKNKPKIHTVSLGKCQATQAEHCDPGDVVVHDDAAQQPKGDDDGQSSAPAPAARRQRRLTRTKRWADACASAEAALQDLMEMQAEFEAWREALPENLSGSAIAEKLDAIGEIDIQAAIDLVEEASGIDLPLGYGRD